MKKLFFILLIFLVNKISYSQVVAPLLANDTFKLHACAQGPSIPNNITVSRCNNVDLSSLDPNDGYIKMCNTLGALNESVILFKSISSTGTNASFRIVNISNTATIKVSIVLIGQGTQFVSIAPNSKSEIINAINIKNISAVISCTNRLGVLDENATGLFQWIK